jgi:hypothetical protein
MRFVESLKELIETTQAFSSEEQSSDEPSFLFSNYNVGTERAKLKDNSASPDPKDLRPIREYIFENPSRQIKQLREFKNENATTTASTTQ